MYATRTDLEACYGTTELTQRESALPTGAVAKALTDADALINGYVGGRYAVPLAPVPDNLPRLACAVARYYLLGESRTEQARQDYEDAVSWLKGVAAGSIPLPKAAEAATPETGGTAATHTRPKRFDAAGLESY